MMRGRVLQVYRYQMWKENLITEATEKFGSQTFLRKQTLIFNTQFIFKKTF